MNDLARCQLFLVGALASVGASPELEELLAQTIASAQKEWPEIVLSPEAFLGYVARYVDAASDVAISLRALHTSDLYLAAACANGDARALAAFERDLLLPATPVLLRMQISLDVVDEARQILRARFFTGDAPRIHEYAGTGPLRGWVRAALVRESLRGLRAPKGRLDVDQQTLGAIASPGADLELDYLKRFYGAEATAALEEGFARLEARERNVLRQYLALGMTIDDLATLYRVHRATAARWVTKARETLVANTRQALRRRHEISSEDVSSIMRLIESQLAEGVQSLLGAPS